MFGLLTAITPQSYYERYQDPLDKSVLVDTALERAFVYGNDNGTEVNIYWGINEINNTEASYITPPASYNTLVTGTPLSSDTQFGIESSTLPQKMPRNSWKDYAVSVSVSVSVSVIWPRQETIRR